MISEVGLLKRPDDYVKPHLLHALMGMASRVHYSSRGTVTRDEGSDEWIGRSARTARDRAHHRRLIERDRHHASLS
jgi:hypothetical protein